MNRFIYYFTLTISLFVISCNDNDSRLGYVGQLYFDVESTEFNVDGVGYANRFFIRDRYDNQINVGWGIFEALSIENGDTLAIANTFVDGLPTNVYKSKLSGHWFYLEKDVEGLNVSIDRNESGSDRTLIIKIDCLWRSTEDLILHQPAK